MTETIEKTDVLLDEDILEDVPPVCDETNDDREATWGARFAFPCEHQNIFMLCDKHASYYRSYSSLFAFNCPICTASGEVVSLWKI